MLNEYKKRDLSKRYRVKFISKKETILNSWDLTNFIKQVSGSYYKLELINSISLALNEGISPKNIFVMNRSFLLNENYDDLLLIDLTSPDITKFYRLGIPVSLFPNEDLFLMSHVFNTFYTINSILFNERNRRLDTAILANIFPDLNRTGVRNISEGLENNAIRILGKTISEKEVVRSNIENRVRALHSKFEKSYNDFSKAEVLAGLITKEGTFDFSKNPRIEEKFFDSFFKQLMRLSRPTVGIYSPEHKTIQILGHALISQTKRNGAFLDIKSYSHNSPLESFWELGASVYNFVTDQKKKSLEVKQLELDIELKSEQIQTEKLRQQHIELQNLSKANDILTSSGVNEVKHIANAYLQQKLNSYNKMIVENAKTTLRETDIEIDSIIDISV